MSSTRVSTYAVRKACLAYIEESVKEANADLEIYIEQTRKDMKSWWYGTATTEQAIEKLKKDGWEYYYWELKNTESRCKQRVEPLMALCDVSIDQIIELSDTDAKLIKKWSNKQ